ncbi:MAG: hypothetical protein K1X78_18845 [Verrucomicrobiaceae bacterium]|nr:hypothetical protein [Verrucomicrobiaceae bacterium]
MKKCFVIMPIKSGPEFEHFRAVFENLIKPTVEKHGYDVKRADDLKGGGSISKDIILPLAQADLVVADLTGLNPNVFYELGVRHALRGKGTIMLLDESRGDPIPFDITTYRVLRFCADIKGMGALTREMDQYIKEMEGGHIDTRDNMVHDWLPSLPMNVLDSSLGSEEGKLRSELQTCRRRLKDYEDRYGTTNEESTIDPLSVILEAQKEAKEGNLPSTLVDEAEKAAQGGNSSLFLEKIAAILQLRVARPTMRQLMRLFQSAEMLDLPPVTEALLDHALKLFPENRELVMLRLQTLAHADNPKQRAKARSEFLRFLGIEVDGASITFQRPLSKTDLATLGVMFDAYHQDGMHDEALRLIEPLRPRESNSCLLTRNYARVLQKAGKFAEAMTFFRKAAVMPSSDDTSAIWFGNELHNAEQHRNAAEAYLVACMRDPNDGAGFSHFADELAWLVREALLSRGISNSPVPLDRLKQLVAETSVMSLSCRNRSAETVDRLRSACERSEVDFGDVAALLQESDGQISTANRIAFARQQFDIWKTELTDPSCESYVFDQ